jgi:hypothetical protein
MGRFRVVYDKNKAMWYIEDDVGQKVRIANPTTGQDTGFNKGYVLQRGAEVMCDRLNNGERPKTVVIP